MQSSSQRPEFALSVVRHHRRDLPRSRDLNGADTGWRPLLLGARTLLVTKRIATRNKKLLGAPGHTSSNKKLLVTSASLLVISALLVVTRRQRQKN